MSTRISIIGTGFVGASIAFALVGDGMVSDLVLVDKDRKKAEGEAMDLNDGASFIHPVRIIPGELEDCKGSKIVIITAGANQNPNETRLDLAERNTVIIKELITRLASICPAAIFLIVTNPVDVLTYVALKNSNLSPHQVIGSGTVLDSSRFRQEISTYYDIDARNVHAYIVGEHGDSEVPLWSLANIGGTGLSHFESPQNTSFGNASLNHIEVFNNVKNAAYHIIERKGATYYAIALAVRRIIKAILRDENSILTISSLLEGQYGIKDVCLSLPCLVNSKGRHTVFELPISNEEKSALQESARLIKNIINTAS